MTTMNPKRHPSGRPVARSRTVRLPITREPPDEPLTPGLRRPVATCAIGFHVDAIPDDDDDDDDEEETEAF
jgi:hypothetical protein